MLPAFEKEEEEDEILLSLIKSKSELHEMFKSGKECFEMPMQSSAPWEVRGTLSKGNGEAYKMREFDFAFKGSNRALRSHT